MEEDSSLRVILVRKCSSLFCKTSCLQATRSIPESDEVECVVHGAAGITQLTTAHIR